MSKSNKPKPVNEQVTELLKKALSALKGRRKTAVMKNVTAAFVLLGGKVGPASEADLPPETQESSGLGFSGRITSDAEDLSANSDGGETHEGLNDNPDLDAVVPEDAF